jgi:exodeoxyribonuclease VII large subunit
VIRDILHRLRDRFPRQVLIWPVAVQGERCAPEVARAIAGFNALVPGGAVPRPDLIIVARGGGSIEDLWGFNEEAVVRAAAASEIPLISAVGHETDTTLIDHAADRRAPTPTAAAEMAVPVRLDLLAWTGEQGARLGRALSQGLGQRRQRLSDLARALPKPQVLTETARQRLDRAEERLRAALTAGVQLRQVRLHRAAGSLRPAMLARLTAEARRRLGEAGRRLAPDLLRRDNLRRRHDLGGLAARLGAEARARLDRLGRALATLDRVRLSVGYTETLKRGYAVVRGDGRVVTDTESAKAARALELQFADGRLALGPKRRAKPDDPPDQGSLF